MRILVCAAEAPLPPLNGFRLQLSPVCAELARRHEVVVLAYRWPEQHGEPPPEVELRTIERSAPSSVQRGLTWLLSPRPLGAVTAGGPMARAAGALLEERSFDVLHVMGWNLAGIVARLPDLPAVLTTLDAWFLNYGARSEMAGPIRGRMYRREARRIRRFERTTYSAFQSVVVVSAEDARAIGGLDPSIRPAVIPNGVDARHYTPRLGADRDSDLVVFTGAMHWSPNVDAAIFLAREVLPRLRERRPGARVAIVGRSPLPEVLALGELDGVEVTGEVADVREWLWRAGAFVCPMRRGTGIKNKLLEAMACETPCAVTPLARQGLEVTDGRELEIGETAAELADAIAILLDDRSHAGEIGRRGRRYVAERHTWEAVAGAYERLLGDAAARRL